jgi:hypothetical protein
MKVAILSSHLLWSQHYETELEIMQNHLNDGDEVLQLVCTGELGICDSNLNHDFSRCLTCISRREMGVSLLEGRVKQIKLLQYASAGHLKEAEQVKHVFDSLFHLQEFKIDGYPIGYAVGSSLVSILRDSTLDLEANGEKIRKYLQYSLLTYRAAQEFLKKEKPDRVYIFNGRLPVPRAMLSACTDLGVECMIHERGNNYRHYELFRNRLPQDLIFIQELIEEAWDNAPEPQRTQVGKDFYIERRKGAVQGWKSFIDQQSEGLIPANWDPTKHNIVIFNSSEDEFISCTDDWKNKLYMSQYDAIRLIAKELSNDPDICLYLRAHPNLKSASQSEKEALESMRLEPLTYIPPDSDVSSYALLDMASTVLVFNSTMGIEATYWDKPSVLAGPSLYDRLGSNYIPTTHEEVMALLRQRHLAPMPKEGAIKYGYYTNSFGIPFKHFEPEGFVEGKFKGVEVVPYHVRKISTLQHWILKQGLLKPLHHILLRRHMKKPLI